VVGGLSERARKLRQAISIAVDWEEFISIFQNGRGIPGMGPIPPGIFGYLEGEAGLNPVVYDWVEGGPRRKPVETAKQLLAQAGYPDGRDAAPDSRSCCTSTPCSAAPATRRGSTGTGRQFQKLNIQLELRTSDWNRFQEKVRAGNTQLFFLGWNADYPDPENFLFLLNGPQSRAKTGGENTANYQNPEYDRLFERMKNMPNGPERQALIDQMVRIVRVDAPWAWGFHPKDYGLAHAWLKNVKPNQMARNGLKFYRLDTAVRETDRAAWNRPDLWPIGLGLLVLAAAAVPAVVASGGASARPARPA